jgi:hypothetical protein
LKFKKGLYIIDPMNKKVMAIVGILVVIVGLYGAYRVYKHFKRLAATPAVQTQNTTTATKSAPSTTLGSLKDLITKGVAQTCTYSTDKSQGTIYMDGGKVRGDITATGVEANSQPVVSHLIIADNMTYLWTDGRNVGFKMTYDPNATPAPAGSSTTNSSGALDPNTQMNYTCNPWVADGSKFTLPTDVTFSTLSLPSQATGGAPAESGSTSTCSYCNNLTGTDKTKCLAALNCK